MRTLVWLAALTAPAAAPRTGIARAFLLGRWTDTHDCTATVEFRRDGSFRTTEGAEGLWAIVEDRLIFQGESVVGARIEALDEDTIELAQDDGTHGQSTRCTARVDATPIEATRSFLLGMWTDTGDCGDAVEFLADGTFVTSRGAQGLWEIEGDRLTFIGNSTVSAVLQAPDENTILLIHPDESIGRSTRCAEEMVGAPAVIAAATVPQRLQDRFGGR